MAKIDDPLIAPEYWVEGECYQFRMPPLRKCKFCHCVSRSLATYKNADYAFLSSHGCRAPCGMNPLLNLCSVLAPLYLDMERIQFYTLDSGVVHAGRDLQTRRRRTGNYGRADNKGNETYACDARLFNLSITAIV